MYYHYHYPNMSHMVISHIGIYRGFHTWGLPLYRWMVYFMEHPPMDGLRVSHDLSNPWLQSMSQYMATVIITPINPNISHIFHVFQYIPIYYPLSSLSQYIPDIPW